MILLKIDTNDQYSRHGLKFFLDTWGILYENKNSKKVIFSETGKHEILIKEKRDVNDFITELYNFSKDINTKDVRSLLKIKNFIKEEAVVYKKENSTKTEINVNLFKLMSLILNNNQKILNNIHDGRDFLCRVPFADIVGNFLFDIILESFIKSKIPLLNKSFWNNKKFILCLTHDVDEVNKTYQYLTRSIKAIRKKDFKEAIKQFKLFFSDKINKRNPYWTFDRIINIEDLLNVRSTFFFLKESAKVNIFNPRTWHHYARKYDWHSENVTEVIRYLIENGWEIGLHGSFYSYDNKDLLFNEKKDLEKIIKNEIIGIRQHHLNLSNNTWKYQYECGFKYDMSVGFKGGKYIGFPSGTSFPYIPINTKIMEIPTTVMDISLNCGYKLEDFYSLIDVIENVKGVFNIIWHTSVFSEDYQDFDKIYIKIIEECKKRNCGVMRGKDIYNWWLRRINTKIKIKYRNNYLKIKKIDKNNIKINIIFHKNGKIEKESIEDVFNTLIKKDDIYKIPVNKDVYGDYDGI